MSRVLLIDADGETLEKMRFYLAEEGYELFSASTADEALSIIAEEEITIVVLDLDIGRHGWQDLAFKLRGHSSGRPLQIVLTAHEKRRLNSALEEAGDDYIQKPLRKLEFQTRIKAAHIRFRNQMRLYKEREYYRRAVKQEEELASRILDRNLDLKQSLVEIETEKAELVLTTHRLEEIAKYDMLSGLLNRMSLYKIIDIEVDRALRTEAPLSGIMMDIDHFKLINDNYGHPAGDEVIRELGRRLNAALRPYDHAGRYGGEEFFILLPNTFGEQAFTMAERFREDLEARAIETEESPILITASLGVAQFRPGETRDRWIARADEAMYTAKEEGRNLTRLKPERRDS